MCGGCRRGGRVIFAAVLDPFRRPWVFGPVCAERVFAWLLSSFVEFFVSPQCLDESPPLIQGLLIAMCKSVKNLQHIQQLFDASNEITFDQQLTKKTLTFGGPLINNAQGILLEVFLMLHRNIY